MKINPIRYIQYFFSTRIKQKLLLSYFILIVLPFGLFTFTSYKNAYSSVESLLHYSAQQSFNQAISFLSRELDYGSEISYTIITNNEMRLLTDKDNEEKGVFEKRGNMLRLNRLNETFLQLKNIYKIRYYTSEEQVFLDNYTYLDIESIKSTEWYEELRSGKVKYKWLYFENNDMSYKDEPTISLVRFIIDPDDFQKVIAILRIDYRAQDIKNILMNTSVTNNTITYLLGPNEQVVSSSVAYDKVMNLMSYSDLKREADEGVGQSFQSVVINQKKVLLECQNINNTDLLLVTIIPQEEILQPSKRIREDMFILLFLVSITAGIFSHMVSKSVIRRRNFQLKALQGQINPHFLYNTLDLINWTAIDHNVPQISSLVKLLSKFYKLSLSKGKDIISIEDELEHAKLYIAIQNMRLDQTIEAVFDIDDTVYSYTIIKILLQPIIENAILHGIMEKQSKVGKIIIKGRLEDQKIFLSVNDNGIGIEPEQLNTILLSNAIEAHGYGLKNINERIKLFYGNKYGLSITSELNKGTTVLITIPAVKEFKKS